MFKVPEEYRLKKHPVLGSDESFGNNGCFIIKHNGYELTCIASDGMGWEHVSVRINRNRTPSWEIMCYVKDLFWDKEECVIQFHPPESKYINNHPYVLHLWRQIDKDIETPNTILIGVK